MKSNRAKIRIPSIYTPVIWWGLMKCAEMIANTPTKPIGAIMAEVLQSLPRKYRRQAAMEIAQEARYLRSVWEKRRAA